MLTFWLVYYELFSYGFNDVISFTLNFIYDDIRLCHISVLGFVSDFNRKWDEILGENNIISEINHLVKAAGRIERMVRSSESSDLHEVWVSIFLEHSLRLQLWIKALKNNLDIELFTQK